MAYLKNENNEIIIDAVLTTYGKEKLSKGNGLGITKYAFSDDEVDYMLYNTAHPLGEEYYDIAIRELPVLEALPNSRDVMKNLLFTVTDTGITYGSQIYIPDIPQVFATGIFQTGVEHSFTPTISPVPDNVSNIFFFVEVHGNDLNLLDINGMVDENRGKSNEFVTAERSLENTSTIKTVVGHYFTVKILSRPLTNYKYNVRITANSEAVVSTYSFDILVLGFNTNTELTQ